MKENQICVADEPRFHTTKFKDTEDLAFKGTKLGLYIDSLEKTISNQAQQIKALIEQVNVLKDTLIVVAESEKVNTEKVELLLLKNGGKTNE